MKVSQEAAAVLSETGLTDEQRRALLVRLERRSQAAEIAGHADVDAGDVEHVLYNLTLSPEKRLSQSFTRAKLRRSAL